MPAVAHPETSEQQRSSDSDEDENHSCEDEELVISLGVLPG